MKKKIIFVCVIFLVILIIIFINGEYKRGKLGNNISVSDNIDILNISSYDAIVQIEIYSNKNTNKYILNQQYLEPNIFKQEVLEPSNIKGVTMTSDGNNVILENNLLGLKQIYENFNGEISNFNLISFVNSYKKGIEVSTEENEEEIIMKTKIDESQNKYQMYQNLYVSKKTNLPTKMEILDVNKNITVYILYKEITVNKLQQKDIV